MRTAKMRISAVLLREALQMPSTAAIVDAYRLDWPDDTIMLVIQDPSFPDVDEPPEIDPTVTERRLDWKTGHRLDWDWHYGSAERRYVADTFTTGQEVWDRK
jgi:hypothetical protein